MPVVYRLKIATLGLMPSESDGHCVPVTIPSDSLIITAGDPGVITNPADEPNQFIEVQWEGKSIAIFQSDFRDRSEPVDEPTTPLL